MARVSINANVSIGAVNNNVAGGMDVLFGGVEVYEVRARDAGWRKPLVAAGVAAMAGLAAWACSRVQSGDERTAAQLRDAVVAIGLTALYAIWAVRQFGMVWRFDHKRKTITRRHWLRGMSHVWNSRQVVGVRLLTGKSRLGAEVARLGLVDASGAMVAELGRWNAARVDRTQIESVIAAIKLVMWWK